MGGGQAFGQKTCWRQARVWIGTATTRNGAVKNTIELRLLAWAYDAWRGTPRWSMTGSWGGVDAAKLDKLLAEAGA